MTAWSRSDRVMPTAAGPVLAARGLRVLADRGVEVRGVDVRGVADRGVDDRGLGLLAMYFSSRMRVDAHRFKIACAV
jgi:hypothetical protein